MDGWMDGYFSPHCLAAPSDGVKLPGTRAKDHNDGTMDSFFQRVGAPPHSLQRSVHYSLRTHGPRYAAVSMEKTELLL